MNKGKTWIFGILFGSILAFTGWNGFKNPIFLMGDTQKVKGKIIEVFPSKEVQNYSRKIKYVYAVDNSYYCDFKKLGTSAEPQAIGNDIEIVYSINNPKWNKVTKLLNNYKNSDGEKYYSNKDSGYIEMHLINGIFKYKEFAEQGVNIHDFVGEYSILNDSIKLKHYHLHNDSITSQHPLIFVFDTDNKNHLKELQSDRIFINSDY
ncbi:hypothetical protein ACUNWD_06350 [Sunxiuqinia sp. A32]|uniref:hypothetical protein n=1 Tax=Sunxiuqinia sp. A32 TaxID=3461496 RepID=UPI004045DBCA